MDTFISWEQAQTLAKKLRDRISKEAAIQRIRVFGVPRGGTNIAQLLVAEANKETLPPFFDLVEKPKDAHIVVDDLIDSGRTRGKYRSEFPTLPFYALIDKTTEDLGWVHFPWESCEEHGAEDNVVRILQSIGAEEIDEGCAARFIHKLKTDSLVRELFLALLA